MMLGVINVTPDSFSDGGVAATLDAALRCAERMIAEGADALDVGGESTRPDASEVSADEELSRVAPVIEALAKRFDVPLSIDTTRASVAEAALAAGAEILNDVGLRDRPDVLGRVAAKHRAVYLAMHSRGAVGAMRGLTDYQNVVRDVTDSLAAVAVQLEQSGVDRGRILLDPGVGFAKTASQSLDLLAHLAPLVSLGYAVCVGPSRKSFIAAADAYAPSWKVPPSAPSARLGGTAAAVAASVLAGAHVLRVHDVAVMSEAARVAHALRLRQGAPGHV